MAALAGLAMAAGCVNLMEQPALTQIAPDWFEEKTVEVKGEGYPELSDIPQVRPFTGTLREWKAQAAELKTSADELEQRHAALSEEEFRTPDEIRATAAQWRALAEGTAVPPASPGQPGQ
jgi:hypothetical protein